MIFLIKSIFLIIVNKKPPFKKVPLILFQFPSPPTCNNWLSHLLNLYSFVMYLYSSSNHFFVSSHLFSPPPPSHKATWSRRMVASCLFWWSFQPKSDRFCHFSFRFCQNWAELTGFGLNLKKRGRIDEWDAKHCVGTSPMRMRRTWSRTCAFLIWTLDITFRNTRSH